MWASAPLDWARYQTNDRPYTERKGEETLEDQKNRCAFFGRLYVLRKAHKAQLMVLLLSTSEQYCY